MHKKLFHSLCLLLSISTLQSSDPKDPTQNNYNQDESHETHGEKSLKLCLRHLAARKRKKDHRGTRLPKLVNYYEACDDK